jgi:hypothetical protein
MDFFVVLGSGCSSIEMWEGYLIHSMEFRTAYHETMLGRFYRGRQTQNTLVARRESTPWPEGITLHLPFWSAYWSICRLCGYRLGIGVENARSISTSTNRPQVLSIVSSAPACS